MEKKSSLIANAPHADITGEILGFAMVFNTDLGGAHREAVYHNALAARMNDHLNFADEPELFVLDELGNVLLVLKPDFVVEDWVIVEIKAHTHPLTNDEMAQVIDYFAASESVVTVALLINFGRKRLEWKRIFPPKKIIEHRESKRRQR